MAGPEATEDFIPLCHLDDIVDGTARGFAATEHARRTIILVRRGAQVFAYVDACPHYAGGTPMAWKKDAYLSGDGQHIACHAHGALFDIATGACVSGPCLGKRLTRVAVQVDPDGRIYAPARYGT